MLSNDNFPRKYLLWEQQELADVERGRIWSWLSPITMQSKNILNICFTCDMKKIACVWKTACVHVLGMLIKKNVWCKFSKNSSAVNSLLYDYFLLFPLYCKWKYPAKWKGKLYTVKPVFKGHPCGVGHIGYSGIFGNQPLHMQFMQRTKVDVSVRFTWTSTQKNLTIFW